MALGFCWFHLWTLMVLGPAVADSAAAPRYILHQDELVFERAVQACSPGTLATLATQQELDRVLQLIPDARQSRFTLWLGLKKAKNECVVRTLPLRGFKWIHDGSQDTDVSRWWVEPAQTCTNNRCGALTGNFDRSNVTKWGLIPLSCKTRNKFICKLIDGSENVGPPRPESATPKPGPGLTTPKLESVTEPGPVLPESPTPEAKPEPATPKSEPGSPKPEAKPEPATPEPGPGGHSPKPEPVPKPDTPKPGLSPPKPETQPATPEPDFTPGSTLPNPGVPGSKSGPEQQGPNPSSHTCTPPHVKEVRSFSPDPDNSSSLLMECWSNVQMKLFCSGRPAVWRLVDHSPVNFTTICLPCDPGFTKDPAGHCVDVDECATDGTRLCESLCVNTEGSYRCVCFDQDGRQLEEGSPECVEGEPEGGAMSGILIPVLAAVAALVVLVVLIVVTVKCCLMRREKKQELREEEERMAMKSKGSS